MEFSLNIFWLIKLAFAVGFLYSVYMAIKKEYKSYLWNIAVAVFLVFAVFTPIRMEQANLNRVHSTEINMIEEAKVLPAMVEDKSFSKKAAEPREITEEEIWHER